VLELLLAPVTVAVPSGHAAEARSGRPPGGPDHRWLERDADLDGYLAAGLPTRSMGREDPLFFAAALVSGGVLAEMISADG
jgi:hypothetical protein